MPNRRISENLNTFETTLENAIENVKFYANSTWSSSEYQNANQGLLKQTEELEHVVRNSSKPRNVRDSIPDSKLARYSNYEYDESRELCYASSVSDISFYYPCIYKRDCIIEPWMLPEVEQIFIWLTYSADFSLLEPLSTEDLERLDDDDKSESERHCSSSAIFHEIKPLLYESVERAPGKSRYTQCFGNRHDTTNTVYVSKLKNVDLEEMMVENRVKCEYVKRLWNESTILSDDLLLEEQRIGKEDTFSMFKSPLGNYFIFENMKNMRNIPSLFKIDANSKNSQSIRQENKMESLKGLNDSLISLEENLLSYASSKKKYSPINESSGRRLYSAVVQGVPSKPSSLSRINESTDTVSLTSIRSVVSTDVIDEQKSLSQKLPIPFSFYQQKCQRDILLKKPKESIKNTSDVTFNTFSSSSSHRIAGMLASTNNSLSSSLFGGNAHTTPSSAHLFLSNYNTSGNCLSNFCGNTYLHNYHNSFTPSHMVIQNARQSFTNNVVAHQPLWLLQHQQQQQQQQQQLRHQTYYPGTSCHGFVYLPSPARSRLPQRWPPFFKPLSSGIPSSSSSAPFQSWGQNSYLYKGNSAQYFATKQNTDYCRSRITGSRQNLNPSKIDRNNKPTVDEISKDCSSKNSSCSSDNPPQVPQTSTRIRYFYRSGTNSNIADELERQAIEQYQLNDENFCKELEQQAIEQYENSENWISPSNKFLLFGGLLYKYILFTLYRHLFVIFKVIVTH